MMRHQHISPCLLYCRRRSYASLGGFRQPWQAAFFDGEADRPIREYRRYRIFPRPPHVTVGRRAITSVSMIKTVS